MRKIARVYFMLLLCFTSNFLPAGERSIPVDIFLMIDKSLSMEEPGKFDSLRKWVLDELIDQMLIKGDWICIYQFYEQPEHLLTLNIEDETSFTRVYNTVAAIQPDGHYTDIGSALDTIQSLLDERGNNGRFKVLLLLSDLEQDAPWTSKYRGKQESFKSPYLVEARKIKHDNWYEITLDMNIQDLVVQRTQSLYSDVLANENAPRSDADENRALIQGTTTLVTQSASEGSKTEIGDTVVASGEGQTKSGIDESNTAGISNTSSENTDGTNTATENRNGTMSTTSSDSTDSDDVENVTAQGSTDISGIESGDMNANTGETNANAAIDTGKQTMQGKNDTQSFFAQHWVTILIVLLALMILIVLILLIVHAVKEKQRKEEAAKEKIKLV